MSSRTSFSEALQTFPHTRWSVVPATTRQESAAWLEVTVVHPT